MSTPRPSVIVYETKPDQWRWIICDQSGTPMAKSSFVFKSREAAQRNFNRCLFAIQGMKVVNGERAA